jgi:hypothetical protein
MLYQKKLSIEFSMACQGPLRAEVRTKCLMKILFVTLTENLTINYILLGFALSEEDKTTDRSLEYWFKVIDLDQNDIITYIMLLMFRLMISEVMRWSFSTKNKNKD